MRPLLIVIVAMSILSGCNKRSNRLDGFGTIESPGGNWKVEILNEEPGLLITNLIPTKGAVEIEKKTGTRLKRSISPSDWVSTSNAFVIIDPNDRVWAFNGTDQTFMIEPHKGGSRSWSINTWKGEIPSEFLMRLPNTIRSHVEAAGPNCPSPTN